MKVTVIGSGYVGLVTAACLADLGNDVYCLDDDAAKVALLQGGGLPIHEPGLAEVVQRNVAGERLRFGTDAREGATHGKVQFIAVGTPEDSDGSADLQYVLAAARELGRHMSGDRVVVDKSTVPVGTARAVGAVTIRATWPRARPRASPVLKAAARSGTALRGASNPGTRTRSRRRSRRVASIPSRSTPATTSAAFT